ncbi:hypothetical protein [Virgibacillus pantothenticus]|nr:hypothetical protein [Virgibacillus pantothenticus]
MKTKSQIVLSLNDQGFTLEDPVSRFLFNKIEKNTYNNKEQYVLDNF